MLAHLDCEFALLTDFGPVFGPGVEAAADRRAAGRGFRFFAPFPVADCLWPGAEAVAEGRAAARCWTVSLLLCVSRVFRGALLDCAFCFFAYFLDVDCIGPCVEAHSWTGSLLSQWAHSWTGSLLIQDSLRLPQPTSDSLLIQDSLRLPQPTSDLVRRLRSAAGQGFRFFVPFPVADCLWPGANAAEAVAKGRAAGL